MIEKHKILLVEDENIIRKGIKKMIEQIIGGYEVAYEASNGIEALRLLEYIQPDIIITDIRMEKMSGLELIHKIRLHDESLPIIIISAYADFRYAQEALADGATAYLVKPIDRIELIQALIKACPLPIDNENFVGDNQIIARVKALIKKQLDQDISLRSLAAEVGINHQYLSVLFKNVTGENFSHYVTRKRIECAKNLLITSGLKVYEVSQISGYRSEKHFSNVFKSITGMTPTEYRNAGDKV